MLILFKDFRGTGRYLCNRTKSLYQLYVTKKGTQYIECLPQCFRALEDVGSLTQPLGSHPFSARADGHAFM